MENSFQESITEVLGSESNLETVKVIFLPQPGLCQINLKLNMCVSTAAHSFLLFFLFHPTTISYLCCLDGCKGLVKSDMESKQEGPRCKLDWGLVSVERACLTLVCVGLEYFNFQVNTQHAQMCIEERITYNHAAQTLTWHTEEICADQSEAGEAAPGRTLAGSWCYGSARVRGVRRKLMLLFSSKSAHARGHEAATDVPPSVWACVFQ